MTLRYILAALAACGTLGLADVAVAGPKGCPPGLAKKDNGCQPPGHAKRDQPRGAESEVIVIRPGTRIDGYDRRWVEDYDRYSLPPLRPGERYYVIDGQVVRVDETTSTVLGLMGLAQSLLN